MTACPAGAVQDGLTELEDCEEGGSGHALRMLGLGPAFSDQVRTSGQQGWRGQPEWARWVDDQAHRLQPSGGGRGGGMTTFCGQMGWRSLEVVV